MEVTDDGIAVGDVIAAVRNVMSRASISAADSDRDVRITAIRLALHAIAAESAGGGVDFRIPFLGMKLNLGGSITRRDTHTVDMTLVPAGLSRQHEIRDGEIETALLSAVRTIRAAISAAAAGDDPFLLKKSTVSLGFAITQDGSFSFGFNGEFSSDVEHRLEISLEPAGGPARG